MSAGTVDPAVSDANGQFTLQASSATPYNVRITRDGWIERGVLFKIPGASVNVSLMPASINLTYFDEMCRSFGRIARWNAAPTLVIETAVLEYPTRLASSDDVPASAIEATASELRRTLPVLSAGRFADFASVEMRRTPAGVRSTVASGTLALTWQRGLLAGFGHVAYGSRAPTAPDGGISSGEVALDFDWRVYGLPAGSRRDIVPVEQHELGHALGYSHTKTSPSFMYEVFLMTVSSLDRQAFEIFMQRPNGNRSPDEDPGDLSLNFTLPREPIIERCEFLRVNRH